MAAFSIRIAPFTDGMGGMIEALESEAVVGWLYYSLYADGSACVDLVEVALEHRRQGVAKKMLDLLIDRHPGVSIYHAAVANEFSQALFDSIARTRTGVTFDVY